MYNNYTPLQQRQLALQEYSNTQSTYLLVYAPVRSTALKATLTDQLHRKFRLVDRLGGELTASVDGVLLAAEDVELMSTALMYFAKALQDGADYVVCNAVFGFGGATALYQSQPLQAQNRCAVVSRTLLERCRAAAHDPENVPELLALAAQLCTKPTLIQQALLHYERGICAEDAFSAHGKRAFIMSHVLDMTGAPIVLVSAVPVLRSMGYEVLVLGPSDGGSLHLFLDAGASVITRSSCRNVSDAWGMALCADFVIANTVVMARAVRALSGTAVPVLWWLHDAFAGYPHIAHQIYGLPDYAAENFVRTDLGYNHGRPLFATVGSFERRKGHDIFCKAIRLLPPEVREKASFLFVGQAADKEMMDSVRTLTADYPENVYYCKRLTRDEIKSLMEQCTGLVCASRDDPMPTFVTEGLIFGKPSIVSEHTGTAGLISEGRNGFVYHNDDPQQLAVLLEHAIEHPEELASMRTECRKMYEQYYSKEAFEQTLRAAVEDLTAKK